MGALHAVRLGDAVALPDQVVIDRLGLPQIDELLDDLAATTLYTRRRQRALRAAPAAAAEADAATAAEIRTLLPHATRRWLKDHGICYPRKVGGFLVYSRARARAFLAGRPLPPFPEG